MDPIFAQLSLEYLLAGKHLPWNRPRQTLTTNAVVTPGGSVYMIQADVSKAKSRVHPVRNAHNQYFNLKG